MPFDPKKKIVLELTPVEFMHLVDGANLILASVLRNSALFANALIQAEDGVRLFGDRNKCLEFGDKLIAIGDSYNLEGFDPKIPEHFITE